MRFLITVCVATGCLSSPVSEREHVQSLTHVTGFGSNPGKLNMYMHAPASVAANAPLVVALHGCTQSAADYVGAGWNDLADLWGFYVVYPEQVTANNQQKCFDWFTPGNIHRGAGAPLSIKQMVDYVKTQYSIDPARVFVTGLSAGGAMTAVMLATYPDVFSAGAIMAGLPYACASSQNDAYTCMSQSKNLAPGQWGDLVRGAAPQHPGPYPRVSVWHGDADYTVRPANAAALVKQWIDVHAVSATPLVTETVDGAKHEVHADAAGLARVESYLIPGMGHGTAIEPGYAPAGGCGTAGAYILDRGICSTYYAGRFFGLDPENADEATPPPDETPSPAFTCRDIYASTYAHVLAGRARRCGSYNVDVCAVGSDEHVGLWTAMKAWLKETAPGYYQVGRCP